MADTPPAPAPPAEDDGPQLTFDDRREAVELLFRLTAFERYSYLILSVISAVGLLAMAAYILLNSPSVDTLWSTAATMFGPSGLIVFSQGRVLRLWTDALKALGLAR